MKAPLSLLFLLSLSGCLTEFPRGPAFDQGSLSDLNHPDQGLPDIVSDPADLGGRDLEPPEDRALLPDRSFSLDQPSLLDLGVGELGLQDQPLLVDLFLQPDAPEGPCSGCWQLHRQCEEESNYCRACLLGYEERDGDCVALTERDCLTRHRSAVEQPGGVILCELCLEGYHENGLSCVADSCDSLRCAQMNRSCIQNQEYALCGECFEEYELEGERCVPASSICRDSCEPQHRLCEADHCGACQPGYHELNSECVEDSCENLPCLSLHRECVLFRSGPDYCAGCLSGFLERAGQAACRPMRCEELNCGINRICYETEGEEPAHCGECEQGHLSEFEGSDCRPSRCEDLNCQQLWRECSAGISAEEPAQCGVCLEGYQEEEPVQESCRVKHCDDLFCLNRVCLEGQPEAPAQCGRCSPGYIEEQEECRRLRCEDLNCEESQQRACILENEIALCAGLCLEGYLLRENGSCQLIHCEDLLCEEQGRSCQEESPAYCGDCLEGFIAREEVCERPGCEDLRCPEERARLCIVDNGVAACAGACLEGYILSDDSSSCRPVTCTDLHCEEQNRRCSLEELLSMSCGACLEGFLEREGSCQRPNCEDLSCPELHHRHCIEESGAALCGGACLEGFVSSEEISCRLQRCEDLSCLGENRSCTEPAQAPAACGPCLEGFIEREGLCRRPNCEDLSCPTTHFRGCIIQQGLSVCAGPCLDGYIPTESSSCRLIRCGDLDCRSRNRSCHEPAESQAYCGGCLDDYEEENGQCVEERGCSLLFSSWRSLPSALPLLFCLIYLRPRRRSSRGV